MEYLSSGSGHVDSKQAHDPVDEEELFESTLRRAKEDRYFRTCFLQALTSRDDEFISRVFGGLRTNYPRLSQLIRQRLDEKDKQANLLKSKRVVTSYLPHQLERIAKARRQGRKKDADGFRRVYYYGSGIDRKTLVWPSTTYPWTEESSGGVTWLGVHGLDSICVVTRAQDLDVRRVHGYLKYLTVETVLSKFRKTVISEIEDFAFSSPKPFGVVSVVLGTDDAHEGSGLMYISDEDEEYEKMRKIRQEYMPKDAGYDEKKTTKYLREHMRKDTALINSEAVKASSTEYHKSEAIEFLQEKMKMMNKEAFTVDETIKTAISAFQHLFQKEFKANDIGVCVMDPTYCVKPGEHLVKDIYVKHLETIEIEGHLTAINELAGSEASFELMIPPPSLPHSLPPYRTPSLPILGYSF